jgi:hypothetical protein
VARTDISTPVYDQFSVLSNFSLAVLDDTGWYKTNRTAAEPITWGRGLNHTFLGATSAPNATARQV